MSELTPDARAYLASLGRKGAPAAAKAIKGTPAATTRAQKASKARWAAYYAANPDKLADKLAEKPAKQAKAKR